MPCYHPLPAILKQDGSGTYWIGSESTRFAPWVDKKTGEVHEPIKIPCGKCIGCRLDYSRMWADRCVMESLDYSPDECSFLTLTYNDESVLHCASPETGNLSLVPKDVQDWIKRFRMAAYRKYGVENIRYYMCGEYGSQTFRPHYHVLLFGFRFDDLKLYAHNELGQPLFNSQFLEDTWNQGYCVIGQMNWETCAYTARYVVKKLKGKGAAETYANAGIVPEFVRMSRKPGIGLNYYEENKKSIYTYDKIVLPSNSDSPRIVRPPKYFDRRYAEECPEEFIRIQDNRRKAMEIQATKRKALTDLDEKKYLSVMEKAQQARAKNLLRNL